MTEVIRGKHALTLIGIVAAVALWTAPQASAALACGDVLDHDVKLKNNLDCTASSTDGFEIDADGVTVDLNGHKLIGLPGGYYGIDNSSGHGHLTVKDGTLEGWSYGIYSYQGSYEDLSKLKIKLGDSNDYYGIKVMYAVRPTIRKVTVDNALYGIYLYNNVNEKLIDDRVTNSDDTSTQAVYDYSSTGVIDNLSASGAYYGIYAGGETDGYRIKDSTANDAGVYGFFADYDVAGGGNHASGAGLEDCHNVPCT